MGSCNVFSICVSLIFIPFILATDLHSITNEMSMLQRMTIDEYINYINPPAVHKFQNANGDNILCVKYEDQISLQSGNISKGSRQSSRDNFTYKNSSIEECPEGSVPIMEITRERVERAGSVRKYFKNTKLHVKSDSVQDKIYDHEYALVEMRAERIYKSKAVFNIWQPSVEIGDDISQTSMFFVHQKPDGLINESIAAGLMVNPGHFGNPIVRFFIYRYVRSEVYCLDMNCKGFVQEGKFYPGMPFNHVSLYNGEQREATISIKRETRGNNIVWAVYLRDKLVGHWPGAIFQDLKLSANLVQLGGTVLVNTGAEGTPFSKTEMGSGSFANSGFEKAAYIRHMQLFTTKDALISNMDINYVSFKPNCYDIIGYVKEDNYWGRHIFYGGPGGAVPQCTY